MNRKRITAGLLGLGVAGLLTVGAPSAQACDDGATRNDDDLIAENPATDGDIYGEQSSDTGGVVGTEGESGYIEAGGDASSGGFVQGSTEGDELYGRVDVGENPSVCVNDTSAP